MSYAAPTGNEEMTIQDHTSAAVQDALNSLKSKKRKREMANMGDGGPQSAQKRGSTSSMNGNGQNTNMFLDSQSNSNEFSNLSQQLQAATHPNHGLQTSNMNSTATAALAGILPQMSMPQQPDMSFASNASNSDPERHFDSSFDMGGDNNSGHGHPSQGPQYSMNSFPGNTAAQVQAARDSSAGGAHKPSVGTEEWHKVRRDNHKEVERRRRETINEGINELAKIVPGCEKNKGSILQRAVEYIASLKSERDGIGEKWQQEKMLTEGL
ncbi:MAG: hypothetical protein Q9174_006558, partial [Haloplaca sp. 1 TL-2023]